MFQDFLNSLSLDNKIEVISIIVSLLTSTIAIIISIKTLKQNSKMISDSTRPYVVMYSKTTNFQTHQLHLILKNFGQSGAVITQFECDFDLAPLSYNRKTPFSNFEGVFIAPGQSFSTTLDVGKIQLYNQPITFEISYKNENIFYSDSFSIYLNAECSLVKTRACTKDKELKIISYALQDLVEKTL